MPATPMQDASANVLVKADGTRLTRSALITALGSALSSDTTYQVPAGLRVFEKGSLPGDPDANTAYRQILVPGMQVKTSEIDKMYPTPTVTGVSPATGAAAGGTAVTVKGTGFKNAGTTVTFGGTAATSVVVVDSKTITCVTPAKTAGAYAVAVATDAASPGSLANAFTYA